MGSVETERRTRYPKCLCSVPWRGNLPAREGFKFQKMSKDLLMYCPEYCIHAQGGRHLFGVTSCISFISSKASLDCSLRQFLFCHPLTEVSIRAAFYNPLIHCYIFGRQYYDPYHDEEAISSNSRARFSSCEIRRLSEWDSNENNQGSYTLEGLEYSNGRYSPSQSRCKRFTRKELVV